MNKNRGNKVKQKLRVLLMNKFAKSFLLPWKLNSFRFFGQRHFFFFLNWPGGIFKFVLQEKLCIPPRMSRKQKMKTIRTTSGRQGVGKRTQQQKKYAMNPYRNIVFCMLHGCYPFLHTPVYTYATRSKFPRPRYPSMLHVYPASHIDG